MGRDATPTPGYSGSVQPEHSQGWNTHTPSGLKSFLSVPFLFPFLLESRGYSAQLQTKPQEAIQESALLPSASACVHPQAHLPPIYFTAGTFTSHSLLTLPSIDPFSVTFLNGNDASFLRSQSIWEKREEAITKQNVHSVSFHSISPHAALFTCLMHKLTPFNKLIPVLSIMSQACVTSHSDVCAARSIPAWANHLNSPFPIKRV